jgi:hypothetical protein
MRETVVIDYMQSSLTLLYFNDRDEANDTS